MAIRGGKLKIFAILTDHFLGIVRMKKVFEKINFRE